MTEKENNSDLESMSEEDLKQFVADNIWKVRHCDDYYLEYVECKSLKMKFHNYFVHGELKNEACAAWKEDYKNCNRPSTDHKAFAKIIKHEDERLEKRLKNHLANDVWERRDSPPEGWNSDLPEFLKANQNYSFKSGESNERSCVIF